MRLRTLLIGWVALVFGGSAAVGAYWLAQQSPSSSEIETTSIVVAAVELPRGTTLSAEMLTTKPWPQDYLPPGVLRSLEDAVGRVVWVPILADEPVSEARLTDRGAGRGMAAMIPRGMRAVTLHTPNVSTAMAGFILPGNRVDVLLTLNRGGAGAGSSVILLQNVEVLAVDQQVDAPSGSMVHEANMQSVTLLVSPEQAARLDLGQNRGMLRLALRNPEDTETTEVAPAMLSAEQLDPAPVPPQPVMEPSEPDAVQQTGREVARSDTASESDEPDSAPDASGPEADASESRREKYLPVRTLRGGQSSVLYLRGQEADPRVNPPVRDAVPAGDDAE